MDSAVVPSIPLIPSDEERLLREAVAGIASSYGPAYIRSKHDAGLPPSELWDALAEKGYLGVNIPEEYGGGGRGMTELAAVGEELAAAGCSLLLLVVSPAIAGSILARHGSEEQKDRWLRGIGAGTTKIAFAVTEPDAGTNTHNITTRAVADGSGGYRIRGQAGFKGAGEASNMAKYAAAEAAIRCVDQAIQTHGGNGVAEEYGLSDERSPPAVRTMRIAGGRGRDPAR